jgi:hypothetical protein
MGIREYVGGGLLILATLLAVDTYFEVARGNFSALVPGWLDFATSHSTLFAFLLILGTLLFGGSFVAAVENA